MRREQKWHTIENVTIKRITDKAFLICCENAEGETVEIWIPKSQVNETDCFAEGDQGYMEVTEWIAKQKELLE